jgi:peptidoglycan-N-acetylglucosamine deacetylase
MSSDGSPVVPDPPAVDVPGPAAPVDWPSGHQSAAALTFDLDAEAAVLALDPAGAGRMSVMTHQAYGPLTGVPRLLRILRRHDLRATFFVPGYTAERYPDVVRAIVGAGHEIGHHGYLHESVLGLTADEESSVLDRGLDALDRVAGVRPVGYRAPGWELNYRTPGLLAERGFDYDSSLMDSDVPYLLDGGTDGARDLVEIPVHWGLDDWEQYAFLPGLTGSGVIANPVRVLEMWILELAAMHADHGCFTLTLHPFLTGRPGRAAALEQLVETMVGTSGLWITTMAEIAAHGRSLGLSPRRFSRPQL